MVSLGRRRRSYVHINTHIYIFILINNARVCVVLSTRRVVSIYAPKDTFLIARRCVSMINEVNNLLRARSFDQNCFAIVDSGAGVCSGGGRVITIP